MSQRVEQREIRRYTSRGPVTVYRCRDKGDSGEPFYVFGKGSRGFHFTLPAGTYRIDGGALIPGVKHTPKRALAPSVALRFPFPPSVRVVWMDNPNTAQIDLPRGIIYADRGLLALPEFVRLFVLFHEIGHYWFKDEISCDKFATDQMISRGFQP